MTTCMSGIVINILSGLLGLGGNSGGGMQIGLNYGYLQVMDTSVANRRRSTIHATSSDGPSDNALTVQSNLISNVPVSKRKP